MGARRLPGLVRYPPSGKMNAAQRITREIMDACGIYIISQEVLTHKGPSLHGFFPYPLRII
jgi:hypothetical protein